jgi:hypothetical protein
MELWGPVCITDLVPPSTHEVNNRLGKGNEKSIVNSKLQQI